MKLTWDDSAYDAVERVVLEKFKNCGASMVIQLRKKYGCEDDWEDCTELLLNDGDWINPKWVWENDWWEGEDDVELIAAAPVFAVSLDDKWRIEVPVC